MICAALRAFHISDDPKHYYLTDVYGDPPEKEIEEFMPVQSLTRKEGKRPAILLRYRPPDSDSGTVKVYPGKFRAADTHRVIPVTSDTSVEDVMAATLTEFGLDTSDINKYRLSEVTLDRGSVHERAMDNQEGPWELLKNIARESVRQKELTRFYLQKKKMFPVQILGKPYKFRQIGPIYYEYGSLIITYDNADIAVKAFYMLRETCYEDKNLLVLLLPNIIPEMIPEGTRLVSHNLC
ncbi:diacylglycerol kinase [Caerostris extrusa]|uniref:Diacylglycerol kinase n=1 Tax=Caerostris extrusa TaxID=172846 RepID=A0AAV4NZX7_CAEEX|nr:diacylglycerol kinase [Caerostris extrusa]